MIKAVLYINTSKKNNSKIFTAFPPPLFFSSLTIPMGKGGKGERGKGKRGERGEREKGERRAEFDLEKLMLRPFFPVFSRHADLYMFRRYA